MAAFAGAQPSLEQILADARALIEVESPSEDLAAVAASASVVEAVVTSRLAQAGVAAHAESIKIDGCSHLRWRVGNGGKVLVLTHHDTVWPLGSLAHRPFTVEDGVLTGSGCFDMKVGLAQAVHAISLIAQAVGPAAADGITLLVTGDEEIGSPTSRALIEAEATGKDAVFVLEASGPGGALKTARKGTSMYTLEVTGRAAHAGLEPEKGINAAVELAAHIPSIAALGDPDLGTTVTPTRISAGTTLNTVPAQARLDIDVRAFTAAEQERVDCALRSLTPHLLGASLTLHGGINRPAMSRGTSTQLWSRAAALAPLAGIQGLAEIAVGGASDGNFTAGLGVPTLDGLGAVGGGAHADDEHVLVEHIVPRTMLLALLIADALGVDIVGEEDRAS